MVPAESIYPYFQNWERRLIRQVIIILIYGFGLAVALVTVVAVIGAVDFRNSP